MLISIKDVILKSVDLYRQHFKRFFSYVLLIFVPSALIAIAEIVLPLFLPDGRVWIIEHSYIVYTILAIVLTAFSFWFSIAFVRVMAKSYRGEIPASVGQELTAARGLFWPAVGVSILTGLAVFGGLLLLVIPGIIFGIWFAFSYYSVIIDQARPMDGMRKSKALVDGRWWAVFWRLFLPSILFGAIVAMITELLATPITYILQHTTTTSLLYFTWQVVGQLIVGFGAALVAPLTTAVAVILYLELKQTPVPVAAVETPAAEPVQSADTHS